MFNYDVTFHISACPLVDIMTDVPDANITSSSGVTGNFNSGGWVALLNNDTNSSVEVQMSDGYLSKLNYINVTANIRSYIVYIQRPSESEYVTVNETHTGHTRVR